MSDSPYQRRAVRLDDLDGLIGLAALAQVSAILPHNFIAFEYPGPESNGDNEIVDGLLNPIVQNSLIEVWDQPGLGVEPNPDKAARCLREETRIFRLACYTSDWSTLALRRMKKEKVIG